MKSWTKLSLQPLNMPINISTSQNVTSLIKLFQLFFTFPNHRNNFLVSGCLYLYNQKIMSNRFTVKWIPPILAYTSASICMTLTNKLVLSGFQFKLPFLILTVQVSLSHLITFAKDLNSTFIDEYFVGRFKCFTIGNVYDWRAN